MSLRQLIEMQREAISRERELRTKFKDPESLLIRDVVSRRLRLDLIDGKERTCFETGFSLDGRYYQTIDYFLKESNIPTTSTRDYAGVYSLCVDLKEFH